MAIPFLISLFTVIPFVIGIMQHIIECLIYLLIKNLNVIPSKKYSRTITIPIMVITTSLVVIQAAQFYLTNGAYFWLVIFSTGVYLLWFIMPYLNLLIFWNPQSFLSKIAIGFLLVWTVLISKAGNIVYLDEGGVTSYIADTNLKVITMIVGGILYVGLTFVQTTMNKPELQQIFKENIFNK